MSILCAYNDKGERKYIDDWDKKKDGIPYDILKNELVSKKGNIKMWHFAYKSKNDPDTWKEKKMTEWHRYWQSIVKPENIEITIENHRADIQRNDGWIIEIQHSNISEDEIEEREIFYGNMIWLFDQTSTKKKSIHIYNKYNYKDMIIFKVNFRTFFNFCNKRVFLDTGEDIIEVLNHNSLATKDHYYIGKKYCYYTFKTKIFKDILIENSIYEKKEKSFYTYDHLKELFKNLKQLPFSIQKNKVYIKYYNEIYNKIKEKEKPKRFYEERIIYGEKDNYKKKRIINKDGIIYKTENILGMKILTWNTN